MGDQQNNQIDGSSKAPGTDGLPAGFYQKLWLIISKDILMFCLDVLNDGTPIKVINEIVIVLISKWKQPRYVSDFCFISLCNVPNEIISKKIANRQSCCF